MNKKELEVLLKLCRKHGVQSLSIEGVSLTLSPHFSTPPKTKLDQTADVIADKDFTDEDILNWSASIPI